MTLLKALETWYAENCDGDWEHSYGVTIETLDNPGWSVKIDLNDTPLSDKEFEGIHVDRTERNWVRCTVEATVFKGYGGPGNLREILEIFVQWGNR